MNKKTSDFTNVKYERDKPTQIFMQFSVKNVFSDRASFQNECEHREKRGNRRVSADYNERQQRVTAGNRRAGRIHRVEKRQNAAKCGETAPGGIAIEPDTAEQAGRAYKYRTNRRRRFFIQNKAERDAERNERYRRGHYRENCEKNALKTHTFTRKNAYYARRNERYRHLQHRHRKKRKRVTRNEIGRAHRRRI